MTVDVDKQEELREFVKNHVSSNLNSLFWEMRERMDHGFYQFLREMFDNFEWYNEEKDRYEETNVLEWWAVDDWLHRKLKEKDECVADLGSLRVWGRTTSGQAIWLDGVIEEIYDDLQEQRKQI